MADRRCESCRTTMADCLALPDDEPCCGDCAHLVASFDFGREPQPSDGPDYQADHAAWKRRVASTGTRNYRQEARGWVIWGTAAASVAEMSPRSPVGLTASASSAARQSPPMADVGIVCGGCGSGPVYMEACPEHEWATASECQNCGDRYEIGPCQDCVPATTEEASPDG